MSTELSYLTKKLFKKDSFRDLSAVELDELVGKFPYSALLQFLYAKKLKDKNAFGYPDAAARSALYFNNPHWLNHLINDQDENGFSYAGVERIKAAEKVVFREVAFSSADNFKNSEIAETVTEEYIEPPFKSESEPQNPVQMHEYETTDTFDPGQNHDERPPSLTNGLEENLQEKTEKIEAHDWNEPKAEATAEEVVVPVNLTEPEPLIEENIEPVAEAEQEIENAQMATESNELGATTEENIETEPKVGENIQLAQPVSEIKAPIGESEIKSTVVEPQFKSPFEIVSKADEPLVPIEPLYAIDYFASQGIRLTPEEETKDKLGRSLKSFTEWLKSMKRIHPEKMAAGLDPGTEKHIQSEAEHSNEETEVNTEAMAEVLSKQGRREKAIELYEKLSLLNPAKSVYFAAKIKDLKER